MKAFLVAYDCMELHKKSKNTKNTTIWICQRLFKIANNPNWIVGYFRGFNKDQEKSLEYYSYHGNKYHE